MVDDISSTILLGGMKYSWCKNLKVQTNMHHHLQSQTMEKYPDHTLNSNVSCCDVGKFENAIMNLTSTQILAAPS
jgi:hypothetical protein